MQWYLFDVHLKCGGTCICGTNYEDRILGHLIKCHTRGCPNLKDGTAANCWPS